jgi:low affinity Fe/Cu permease
MNTDAVPVEREHELVLSKHHRRGPGALERIAGWVNAFIGSMWTFVGVTTFIVVWLFASNIVGFDRTPWPLLLTLLNLPQLSIMISLQVSANLAQRTSDARAVADHETLVTLHRLSRQQLRILDQQNEVLALLKARAEGAGGQRA